MMRMLSAAMMVLLLASSAFGQLTVVETPVASGSFAEVSIKLGDGQSAVWLVSPDPVKAVEQDTVIYFNGPAGTYKVTAIVFSTANNKVVTKKYTANVVLGSTPAPPVDPPTPTDAFTQAIQAAFTSESATDKAVNTSKLASLYRVAAKNTVTDPSITTYSQLFDTMKTASKSLLPETAIPAIRKVIGSRLNQQFGAASSTFDRVKLASEFNAIADALSSAK